MRPTPSSSVVPFEILNVLPSESSSRSFYVPALSCLGRVHKTGFPSAVLRNAGTFFTIPLTFFLFFPVLDTGFRLTEAERDTVLEALNKVPVDIILGTPTISSSKSHEQKTISRIFPFLTSERSSTPSIQKTIKPLPIPIRI